MVSTGKRAARTNIPATPPAIPFRYAEPPTASREELGEDVLRAPFAVGADSMFRFLGAWTTSRKSMTSDLDNYVPLVRESRKTYVCKAPNDYDVSVDKTQVRALPGRALLPR